MTGGPIIVVEGETDAAILGHVLGVLPSAPSILVGHGRSSAISLARSALVARGTPTALVLDANSTDEDQIVRTRVELEEALTAAGSAAPYHVCLAIPTIEAWLWRDSDGMKRILNGTRWPDVETEARFAPKRVLVTLLEQRNERYSPQAIDRLMARVDLARIRNTDEVRGLLAFLNQHGTVLATEAHPS